jgi:hypothetical protein
VFFPTIAPPPFLAQPEIARTRGRRSHSSGNCNFVTYGAGYSLVHLSLPAIFISWRLELFLWLFALLKRHCQRNVHPGVYMSMNYHGFHRLHPWSAWGLEHFRN